MAEEIFITIENPDEAAYSALIQGMCKYFQVDRAHELYEETQKKGIVLDTGAYNALVTTAPLLKEDNEQKWMIVKRILMEMNQAKVKPNVHTLNAVLESLSMMGFSITTKRLILMTLAEFKKMGIEPTLGSWYHVLNTYCKDSEY